MARLTDGAAAYVAEAAIAWDQSRRAAACLRAERASLQCEHESPDEYNNDGTPTGKGEPACWKNTWVDQLGRDCVLPREDWCAPCQQRQTVHEAYTKAVAHRQGLMRGLQRRALTAWESSDR